MRKLIPLAILLLINFPNRKVVNSIIPELAAKPAKISKPIKYVYTEVSWYGPKFNGKKTANGEVFNQNKLIAASPYLPFNTRVKIINISNNKSVIVTIKDRGPYKMHKNGKVVRPLTPHPKRGFDLSKGAFKKIAPLEKGVIKVKAIIGF